MITTTKGTKIGRRERVMFYYLIGPILVFSLMFPEMGWAKTKRPLSAQEKTQLVNAVSQKLLKLYPDDHIGEKTSVGILSKLSAGKYNNITSRREFVGELTRDMEALSNDKHLDVYYDPQMAQEIIARQKDPTKKGEQLPSELEHARFENYGFKSLKILDGKVGYVDLRMFFDTRNAGSTALSAMMFLSDCNAIIIDLRRNGGGWDDMVTLLASFFGDIREPEIMAIAQSTLDQSYFVSVVPSFVPGTRLSGIPLYILTSRRTASAAEAFISIVKKLNKKTMQVGETTAGAENPVEYVVPLQNYVLKIPCWKKITFGDRLGWESKGISPDIPIEASRALEEAHLHALESLSKRFEGKIAKEKISWGLDGLKARRERREPKKSVAQSYVGTYNNTNILLDERGLWLKYKTDPVQKLHLVRDDYFIVGEDDYFRIRFIKKKKRVVAIELRYADGYTATIYRN